MYTIRDVSTREDYRILMETLNEWEEVARKKAMEVDYFSQERYENVGTVANLMKMIPYHSIEKKENRVLIYTDRHVGSVAVVGEEPENLRLKCLLSNPRSLGSGMGRVMMNHLFGECLVKEKKSISLNSMSSSVTFYDKMHFTRLEDCSEEGGEMLITAEKIKQVFPLSKRS